MIGDKLVHGSPVLATVGNEHLGDEISGRDYNLGIEFAYLTCMPAPPSIASPVPARVALASILTRAVRPTVEQELKNVA